MARCLAPAVKLSPEAKRTMEDQLEMIVSKQMKLEDRDLMSVRECRYLLTRPYLEQDDRS